MLSVNEKKSRNNPARKLENKMNTVSTRISQNINIQRISQEHLLSIFWKETWTTLSRDAIMSNLKAFLI